MVLFYPCGPVEVMDSDEDPKHVHYPIDAAEESRFDFFLHSFIV